MSSSMYQSDIINIAIMNFKVNAGKKEANLNRMIDMSRAAARRGADMILFPEMCLMGYDYFLSDDISREEKIKVTETIKGPSTAALEKVAREEGIYIIFGMSEKMEEDAELLYNSAVALGPDGLIGSYQKIHPWSMECKWCEKGETPLIFDTKWGPVSIAICYDNYTFPEILRYYVYKGARLHLNPTAVVEELGLTAGSRHSFKRGYAPHLECGAMSNSVYIASSNLTGYDMESYFAGGSIVVGPKTKPFGEVDSHIYMGDLDSDQAQMYIGTLDLSLATRHLCQESPLGCGADYRPEIYKKLFDEIG